MAIAVVMHLPLSCYADVYNFNIGLAIRFGSIDNLSKCLIREIAQCKKTSRPVIPPRLLNALSFNEC